jgi:hypothetical protein
MNILLTSEASAVAGSDAAFADDEPHQIVRRI